MELFTNMLNIALIALLAHIKIWQHQHVSFVPSLLEAVAFALTPLYVPNVSKGII